MKAVILSIGQELTSGQTVDTNSAWLSRKLGERGIETIEHRTVADQRRQIADAIAESVKKVDLLIVTGGLGPTEDDLTRFALADVLGVELVVDAAAMEHMEAFFRGRRWRMSESNRVQAMAPRGANMLPNLLGTAPGLSCRIGAADVYVMPGVPYEMKDMYARCVAPHLPAQRGAIIHHILHTFGAGESNVGAAIADLMKRDSNPLVGTTVAGGMVSIRIISKASTADEASELANATARQVKERLGAFVVGEGDDTMASVVGGLLRRAGATLSTAESCTGGMVGEMITAVPGSSEYYTGGIVAYANQVKMQLLGVSEQMLVEHGAVSEPVAMQMAVGARERFNTTWAVSITGVAGPGGGTEAKPVGLVYVGLAGKDCRLVERLMIPGLRDIVRLRASLNALNILRMRLIG